MQKSGEFPHQNNSTLVSEPAVECIYRCRNHAWSMAVRIVAQVVMKILYKLRFERSQTWCGSVCFFERVSLFISSMVADAALGIALVTSRVISPKATEQQVESTGHGAVLDGGLAWIDQLYNQRARHFTVHLDMSHLPSSCGLPQAPLLKYPSKCFDVFQEPK